jgi:hypothetical protein
VHLALRRLATLLVIAAPTALVAWAGVTWGAARDAHLQPRQARTFEPLPGPAAHEQDERTTSAVVLVVLDGVRAQEVFGGADRDLARARGQNPLAWANPRDLTPNLQRMLDTDAVAVGVPGHGAELVASGPRFISLPGYLEIFAGKPDPGCEGNECVRPPAHTIADDVRASSGADDVAVITSWPNIARAASADPSAYVMSAGRKLVSRGDVLRADPAMLPLLDRGARVKAYPGEGDYRPDAFTSKVALRVLETSHPRLLFVGLGDADEYAHRGDYHGYLQAVHASDAFLGDLQATLARMGARGRHTTVLVTADHGRAYSFVDHGARYPESARVWLVAAGGDVRSHGILAAATRHTLSDIAPTVRAFLGIQGDGNPISEVFGEPGAPAGVGPGWRSP